MSDDRDSAGPPPRLGLASRLGRAVGLAPVGPEPAGESPARPAPAAGLPFEQVAEQAPDALLIVTGADRVEPRRYLWANAAARSLFRVQRPEGPLATLVRTPEVLAAVDEALFGGVAATAAYYAAGAQDRVWRVRAEPLAGPGPARLAVVAFVDETEIRRSERARADFLANASHELRTPLASLAGFIETLRGHARQDEAARERFLAVMQVQADRMRRLIDDLLSLSRIEQAEHIAPSDVIDLAPAVADVLDGLAPLTRERGVSFAVSLPAPGEAMVVADRDQILQVVQNLAENALKYSPEGGEVRVTLEAGLDLPACGATRRRGAARLALLAPQPAAGRLYALLRVEDDGPGITRASLPRLAERFYRVEGQKSGAHAGTGLGLAIVKHIVRRHRGGLAVESAEGAGAAFAVAIPLAERGPEET